MNVPIKKTNGKKIDTVIWPDSVDEEGFMRFGQDKIAKNPDLLNVQIKPDVMVFATGYTQEFPFLDKDYPVVAQTNVRGVYKDGDVTLGFIGLVRPAIGE